MQVLSFKIGDKVKKELFLVVTSQASRQQLKAFFFIQTM